MRIKNANPNYCETSDSENENDEFCHPQSSLVPPLPSSPPPSESVTFSPEYIDELFKQSEKEWSSEAEGGSIASSTFSDNRRRNSFDSGQKSASVSRSGSDLGSKSKNYTNNADTELEASHCLRRIQSFSNAESVPQSQNSSCYSSHQTTTQFTTKDENSRERPVTIAVYDDQNSTNFMQLNSHEKSNYSKIPGYSIDNLVNIHPEHKIYSKVYINKGSIRKVLSRLVNFRSSLSSMSSKAMSEPSQSLSSIYLNSEFERSSPVRKSANLVSSMARQYSRTLKERIKQIRTENDNESQILTTTSNRIPSTINLNPPKLNFDYSGCKPQPNYNFNSSIGARLATTNENVEYAVPSLLNNTSSAEMRRPDSVLSSSSIWTSTSTNSSNTSSSTRDVKTDIHLTLSNNDDDDNSSGGGTVDQDSVEDDDSFYEKSFEAIESYLEDDMFRDSAIYSDPEDSLDGGHGSGLSPRPSFKSSLSPRPSFKSSLSPKTSFKKENNSVATDNVDNSNLLTVPYSNFKKTYVVASKSFDSALLLHKSEEDLNCPPTLLSDIDCPPQSLPNNINKKTPPPVPVKPDTRKLLGGRLKGNLIQKQLEHLKESQLKSLNGNEENDTEEMLLEDLKSLHKKQEINKENSKKLSQKHRKSSLDSYLNPSPFSYSPQLEKSSNLFKEICENDQSMMSKGWVQHVICKLQQ